MIKISAILALPVMVALSSVACSGSTPSGNELDAPQIGVSPDTVPPMSPAPGQYIPLISQPGSFAKGADVGWLTELEAKGEVFYDLNGQPVELMQLLRDECGINSIRLRVWVDPTEGWNNIDDVLVKARRARELGLRLMIDFHFSDWWADPGKQNIPQAWSNMSLDEAKKALAAHVADMLSLLKAYDIEPEWVQVGNETRTGMMWPLGSTSNGTNFSQLVNAGYDAVKAIFPNSTVIIHCDEGNKQELYDFLFGKLEAEGARYDMIGMSLYPESGTWQKTVDDRLANIRHCQQTFKKPVMICEVGFDVNLPLEAEQMLQRMLDGALENDVKGIFWWEPESTFENSGYGKGAFNNGRPTGALNPFK